MELASKSADVSVSTSSPFYPNSVRSHLSFADSRAVIKHLAWLRAETSAVSLVATLPDYPPQVEIFRDGRVERLAS